MYENRNGALRKLLAVASVLVALALVAAAAGRSASVSSAKQKVRRGVAALAVLRDDVSVRSQIGPKYLQRLGGSHRHALRSLQL